MKNALIRILKTIFSDVRQTVISTILLLIVGGSSGLLLLSQKALDFSIQLANTATPLWATIAVVLLCCSYTYLKFRKIAKKLYQNNQSQCSPESQFDISKRLNDEKDNILDIITTNDRLHSEQIADKAGLKKQKAILHLQEMEKMNLVSSKFGIDSNHHEVYVWSIEQKGRKYLHHHGLL